jgi:hypothetical protein
MGAFSACLIGVFICGGVDGITDSNDAFVKGATVNSKILLSILTTLRSAH